MIDAQTETHYRWSDLPAETLKGSLTRRMITGGAMMIAEVRFAKGDTVPKHSHHNEQFTYIPEGALQFTFGEEQDRVVMVRTGEVVVIPPHVPHSVIALEDTIDIDIFSPPREDWLSGTDSYIRNTE